MYDEDDGPQGIPAVTWGLIFAIAIMVPSIVMDFLVQAMEKTFLQYPDTLDGSIPGRLIILLFVSGVFLVVCCAGAGFLTARDTGSIKAGAFAGGLALFAATFIDGIIRIVFSLATPVEIYAVSSHAISVGQLAGAGLLEVICVGGCCIGFLGAALGALGAIPARLIWGPAEG